MLDPFCLGGGASRQAYATEWARLMVYLQAMQGLGKPGVNLWTTANGAPFNPAFTFPGYSFLGIDKYAKRSIAKQTIKNPVSQRLYRPLFADAVLNPPIQWRFELKRGTSLDQFHPYTYPEEGKSECHMFYRHGGSFIGTMVVKGACEFAGKTYAGRQPYPNHLGKFTTCVECHMGSKETAEKGHWTMEDHNVAEPVKDRCVACHGNDISQTYKGGDPEKFDFEQIRPGNIPDYDADGNTKESLKDEILGLENVLYVQIQAYMRGRNAPVAYDSSAYPYWFKDLNNNGIVDPSEATSANGARFDAKGLRGAFNYQVSHKEPHGFIHNARYIAQILVDSIQHVGGDISAYTWR